LHGPRRLARYNADGHEIREENRHAA